MKPPMTTLGEIYPYTQGGLYQPQNLSTIEFCTLGMELSIHLFVFDPQIYKVLEGKGMLIHCKQQLHSA